MAAIIPGYEYDIFISYRQKDNKQDGWVTEFINSLKNEIEATFKEDISIYFDENPFDGLGETHDVDDSLAKKLKCLIFIPIISKTYCDPNSFAWTNEFIAFNKLANNDEYGLKITLPKGNTASRVLPIKIHDIDDTDRQLVESEIGFLRSIDFVYQEAGVNRPLKPEDNKEDNLNKTSYRNQINKVANAIQDIISGLKAAESSNSEEQPLDESASSRPKKIHLTREIKRRNVLRASLVYILTALVLWKVTDISASLFNLSGGILKIITLALIVLFPISILMAWLYERSPKGFIKTGSAASRDNPFTDAQKKPLTSNTFIFLIFATVLTLFFIFPRIYKSEVKPNNPNLEKSIAVLPFTDMSPDKDQEYLGDGLAEEIINSLTRIKDLKVTGRTSSFRFKNEKIDLREIGQKLQVSTILEGSIQKFEDRVRISVQLINVKDNSQIWSQRYDEKLTDIFAIQDNIASNIVEKLKSTLLIQRNPPTENMIAYEMVMRGRHFVFKRTEEGFYRSIEYYQKAIENDPNYALAYASMADSYSLLSAYHFLSPDESLEKARTAALKSTQLDPTLSEGFEAIGHVQMLSKLDWTDSEESYRKAIELNPQFPAARQRYSLLLSGRGKFEEAFAEIILAAESDPLSLIINTDVALIQLHRANYLEAISQCNKVMEIGPNFPVALFVKGLAHEQLGQYEEAVKNFQNAQESGGVYTIMKAAEGHAYAKMSRKEEALRIANELIELSESQYVSPYTIATVFAGLGDIDKTFLWLRKAIENDSFWQIHLHFQSDPRFKDIRKNPNYVEILKE